MARPRVFISSTFYDLRHVRGELDSFISSLGYDVVRHERGTIPYDKEQSLEESCYLEINNCDILVNIVGGRFGTLANGEEDYSISQMEMKVALRENKQCYVFVEKTIEAESRFYLQNKGNKEVKYSSVDSVRVFEFLSEIKSLGKNNIVYPFEYVGDITGFLREQWAGLFQRLLRDQGRRQEVSLVADINGAVKTLREIIDAVQSHEKTRGNEISEILLLNHPIFDALKRITGTPYRVFFKNLSELDSWLAARQFKREDEKDLLDTNNFEWLRRVKTPDGKDGSAKLISIRKSVFDDLGNLKRISPAEWDPASIDELEFSSKDDDDDIPF